MEADSPILLLPRHAFSPDFIVGDIGRVRVTNKTLYDGSEGTCTHRRRQEHTESARGSASGEEGPIPTGGPSRDREHLPKLSGSVLSFVSVEGESLPGRDSRLQSSSSLASSAVSPILSPLATMYQRGLIPSYGMLVPAATPTGEADNSIFGSFQGSVYSTMEADRLRVERQLEAFRGPCLLDCIEVSLSDVDVFSAKRVKLPGAGEGRFGICRQVSLAGATAVM